MIVTLSSNPTGQGPIPMPSLTEMKDELVRAGSALYYYTDEQLLLKREVERPQMGEMHAKMWTKCEEAVLFLMAFMAGDALGLLSEFVSYTGFLFVAFLVVPAVHKALGEYALGRELGESGYGFNVKNIMDNFEWALLTSVPETLVYGPMGLVSMATGYFLIDLVNEFAAAGKLSCRDIEKMFLGAVAAGMIRMEIGPLVGRGLLMRNLMPEVARVLARKAALIYL